MNPLLILAGALFVVLVAAAVVVRRRSRASGPVNYRARLTDETAVVGAPSAAADIGHEATIALLVGVTAVFLVAARPVAAEPSAPGTTAAASASSATTVPADALGLSLAQVTGSGLAVTLDPGASEEHDLVVSNHTANLRLDVKLTATDATGNLGTAAASWLAFGDDAIQLDPHAAVTVPMTIAVPHDTQPESALAHVSATVESAVAAADGSPVAGTANQTFPVSIDVRGTPTAQIAIADVHRVDQGSRHQLAVVLRNFGVQGAQVTGHVRVAGDKPQTLPFHADLAASRDTTVNLDWNAPPEGTASDIAVDLEYGGGNVASWSSRLGGAATDLSPPTTAGPTPTSPIASDSSATSNAATAASGKPWWKQPIVTVLAILALLGAALWFGFEMRASSRRREWMPAAGRSLGPPGWVPAASDESVDLAKQLVRLTDVIVQLVETHRDEQDIVGERARARSPNFETDELQSARAGPAPPVQPALPFTEQLIGSRSASVTPGESARPEPLAEPVAESPLVEEPLVEEPVAEEQLAEEQLVESPVVELVVAEPVVDELVEALVVEEPVVEAPPVLEALPAEAPVVEEPVVEEPVEAVVDPRAAMMERLVQLDRERRRLREWMDAEEAEAGIEPPGGDAMSSDAPDSGADVVSDVDHALAELLGALTEAVDRLTRRIDALEAVWAAASRRPISIPTRSRGRPKPSSGATWPIARPATTADARASSPSSNATAARLSRYSFQLPHFGDCTHDGQPSSHEHAVMRSSVARAWRVAASNASSAMPAPPG